MLYTTYPAPKSLLTGLFLLSLTTSAIFGSCRKAGREVRCDCALLNDGLQQNDLEKVRTEVNKLTADLLPVPSPADEYGQQEHLYILAGRISNQCLIAAQVLHYNGIETLPPQSEVRLGDAGTAGSYSRILDISYTTQNLLTVTGMHD